jgi:DNA primase
MRQGNETNRFSPELLRLIRNQVKLAPLLTDVLRLPVKTSEGHLRFLCPLCGNFHTAVNPKTNLGRCFSCRKNFNPIDMVMVVRKLSFREAVRFREEYLNGNPEAKQNPDGASSNQTGGVRIKETARGKLYCAISRE